MLSGRQSFTIGAMVWLWIALVSSLALVVLAFAGLAIFIVRLMTDQSGNPDRLAIDHSPEESGLEFAEIEFRSVHDSLRIGGWFIGAAEPRSVVILVPGGGTNRLGTGQTLSVARWLHHAGHSILMYDPRGTGHSDGGRMSYGDLECRDVVGAVEYLEGRGFAREQIGLIGWSMGGASAMLALNTTPVGALFLDSPLGRLDHAQVRVAVAEIAPMPKVAAWLATGFIRTAAFGAGRLFLGMNLWRDPPRALREHPVPTFIVHGTGDRRVPVGAGRAAAEAAGASLWAAHFLDGVDHCAAFENSDWYERTLREFFAQTIGAALLTSA